MKIRRRQPFRCVQILHIACLPIILAGDLIRFILMYTVYSIKGLYTNVRP